MIEIKLTEEQALVLLDRQKGEIKACKTNLTKCLQDEEGSQLTFSVEYYSKEINRHERIISQIEQQICTDNGLL